MISKILNFTTFLRLNTNTPRYFFNPCEAFNYFFEISFFFPRFIFHLSDA
ncbi:hypothetical protein PGB90_006655 [Kerria lacca]